MLLRPYLASDDSPPSGDAVSKERLTVIDAVRSGLRLMAVFPFLVVYIQYTTYDALCQGFF